MRGGKEWRINVGNETKRRNFAKKIEYLCGKDVMSG